MLPEFSELEALRAELRCVLQHPAIAPARRQAAEPHLGQCTAVGQLRQWLALAVAECASWEEQTLATEAAQRCGGSQQQRQGNAAGKGS